MKLFPTLFGGLVAYILLVLYSGTVFYLVRGVARCGQAQDCTKVEFNSGMVFVVTTIGGLVSALVVSRLAVEKPGENPAIARTIEGDGTAGKVVLSLAIFYLVGWLATGLGALIVGVMVFPDVNSTLSDIGTSWLGLAVAAGYAYFGLEPAQ